MLIIICTGYADSLVDIVIRWGCLCGTRIMRAYCTCTSLMNDMCQGLHCLTSRVDYPTVTNSVLIFRETGDIYKVVILLQV